jgi:choice-of-anchor C domain-containing protein
MDVIFMGNVRFRLRHLFLGMGMVGALTGLGVLVAPASDAGTATGGTPGVAQNCVTTPGDTFETPVVAPHTFSELSAGQMIGPWTVTPNNVDLNGEGFYQAADGVQSLDLSGNSTGGVERSFDTVSLPLPLFTYTVTYCLAGNPDGGPAVKTGQVLVDNAVVQNFSSDTTGKSRSNMGYQLQKFSFTSAGPTAKVEFRSTTNTVYGPVIDKVTFTKCLLGLFCSSQ